MRRHILMSAFVLASSFSLVSTAATAKDQVKITPKMMSAQVKHNGKTVTIKRNQNQKNTVNAAFAKTSRKCPPFCIRPAVTAPGVETVGEIEVINYIQQASSGASVLLVDARTPDWNKKGTIPSSVNVPFTKLVASKGANDVTIAEALETFGAAEADKGWNFSKAKTLVLFCNGMWCGQSPLAISALLKLGYPAEKLKWYRNGMQDWELLGLSTVKP
ncbi:MAG: rhodanese-like domain-containing protein [Gammaproteobacteria bacterium]|nr:rhodanese-like domain-containing protein [Gammaproteobacteria bacterium]